MFTFRRFTLIFFILLISLNLWNITLGNTIGGFLPNHSILLFTLLLMFYGGISLGLAFMPCTNFHHPVVCRGITDEPLVSLTFDDGPDSLKTPLILEVLQKHQVKAAFFCIGRKVPGNESLLKQLFDAGHLVGNHSYSHSKWFDLFSSGNMRAELNETDRLIANITGKSPLFFRPPFGVVNPMVSNALQNMHWKAICWNIRSLDSMNRNPQKTMHKIITNLKPGSIILLHDVTHFTQYHLDELITRIQEAGYRIVPLDQLLKLPAYAS
jgi:peptidoglycan/xylan/chitin deacetylase (PgdA/CDA1 family)